MFWDNYVKLCNERNLSPNKCAELIGGISSGTVTNWKKGSMPSASKLTKIAEFFEVDKNYLLGKNTKNDDVWFDEDGNRFVSVPPDIFNSNFISDVSREYKRVHKLIANKKSKKIPVLGRVAAGVPIETLEEILDIEEISEKLASTGKFFGLQIDGDSMEPRIYKGDVVIVKQQSDADSGDIVIVLIGQDHGTCKKLKKHEHGISLVSLNNSYDPLFFTWEEVETLPVTIIGKVVELRGKF